MIVVVAVFNPTPIFKTLEILKRLVVVWVVLVAPFPILMLFWYPVRLVLEVLTKAVVP